MGANRPPSEGVECRLGSSIIKTASPITVLKVGTVTPNSPAGVKPASSPPYTASAAAAEPQSQWNPKRHTHINIRRCPAQPASNSRISPGRWFGAVVNLNRALELQVAQVEVGYQSSLRHYELVRLLSNTRIQKLPFLVM